MSRDQKCIEIQEINFLFLLYFTIFIEIIEIQNQLISSIVDII